MMILDRNNLLDILTALKNASIYDFLSSLLASPALTSHPNVQKLISDLPDILQMLGGHPTMSKSVTDACHKYMMHEYANEACCLVSKKNGWHFSAQHTSAEQLEAFSLKDMAQQLMAQAPLLWELVGTLLNADPSRERHCTWVQVSPANTQDCEQADIPANLTSTHNLDWDDEDEYWGQINDNIPLKNSPEPNEIVDSLKRQRRAAQSRLALIQIVSTLRLHATDD